MNPEQPIWQTWVKILQRWGLQDWAAALLEAAGPLTVLGAQVLYISQPLLGTFLPRNHLDALASMLEEPVRARSFANFLREGTSREPA